MIEIFRAALAALIGLIAATATAQVPVIDDAGNRLLPFAAMAAISAEEAERRSAGHCDGARSLCVQARRDGESGPWALFVHRGPPASPDGAPARRIALPPGEDAERETLAIWPHLVLEASGAQLIGVERYRRAGFSGGGAGQTHLVLLRLVPDAAEVAEVLTIQTGYTAIIRACFSEADQRRLGDACHQQLEFSATLTLAPTAAAGRPRFAFAAAARVFPRGSMAEGWEFRRYRRADLVWENDPNCSYGRSFAFDGATGRYAPDQPLPDCSIYTLP